MSQTDSAGVAVSEDEADSTDDDSDESWVEHVVFEWDSPPMLHRKAAALGEDQLDLLRRSNYDSSKRMKCALAALSRQSGATLPTPKSIGPAQKSFVETTLSELQVRHLPALDAFTPRGGVPTLASLANAALSKALEAHYGRVGLGRMPSPEEQALPIPTPYDHNGQLCVVPPAQKRLRC